MHFSTRRLLYKGAYTLGRYRRRFCNLPKTLKCEQKLRPIFFEAKLYLTHFEEYSNFVPILKALANQITAEADRGKKEKFPASESTTKRPI